MDGLRRELQSVRGELSRRRVVGKAVGVTVTVTGEGALTDIVIDDAVLRDSHPDKLGAAVVQAVRDARAAARRGERERLRSVLDPATVNEPTARHPPPGHDDDDELFTGLGVYR